MTLAPFTRSQKKTLFLSALGGVLEFYDFIIYIFLAPIIEKVFFSGNSSSVATLKTLAIFSIGYLLRPLGGIIFSHFGDRYGRKVVFLLTVIFMALPSFGIALLPTPAQIGLASPILLLICRMMQGLALGGEIPAAITFVAEHVPLNRRGFALSTLFFGINMGLLLGSLVTSILTSFLTENEILTYGWRLPFLLGGIFGLASISVRRYLQETAAFTALKKQDLQEFPFASLMRSSSKKVLECVMLVAIGGVSVFFYLYWPQYLHQYFQYDFAQLMRINTMATLVLNISILIGGLLCDRFGSRTLYLIGITCLVLVTYPLFTLLSYHSMTLVMITYFSFSLLFGFIPACYCVMLTEAFPTAIRYSGVATSYNLAYAFFGGFSPIICTLAISTFNSVLAPAAYLILVAILSGMTCFLGRERFQSLKGSLSQKESMNASIMPIGISPNDSR